MHEAFSSVTVSPFLSNTREKQQSVESNGAQEQAMEKFKEAVFKQLATSHCKHKESLIEDRLPEFFSSLKTPNHPPYSEMIQRAISVLDEECGSSEESISNYIEREYPDLPWAHSHFLKHHLHILTQLGEIIASSSKPNYICYLLPNPDSSPDSSPNPNLQKKRRRKKKNEDLTFCYSLPNLDSKPNSTPNPNQQKERGRKKKNRDLTTEPIYLLGDKTNDASESLQLQKKQKQKKRKRMKRRFLENHDRQNTERNERIEKMRSWDDDFETTEVSSKLLITNFESDEPEEFLVLQKPKSRGRGRPRKNPEEQKQGKKVRTLRLCTNNKISTASAMEEQLMKEADLPQEQKEKMAMYRRRGRPPKPKTVSMVA